MTENKGSSQPKRTTMGSQWKKNRNVKENDY